MLRLRDVMTQSVHTATPDMSLRDAMELLSKHHVSGAPVLDGGKVVGVFSAMDVLGYFSDLNDTTPSLTFRSHPSDSTTLEDVTVDDIMTRHVESLPADCMIEEAATFMAEKQIHRIVVMSGDKMLGIVSRSDVAKAVADHRIEDRTYAFA